MYVGQISMWRSHSDDPCAEELVLLEELVSSEVERSNSDFSVSSTELYWLCSVSDRDVWSQMCVKRLQLFFIYTKQTFDVLLKIQ